MTDGGVPAVNPIPENSVVSISCNLPIHNKLTDIFIDSDGNENYKNTIFSRCVVAE